MKINQHILDLAPYIPGKPIKELARESELDSNKIVKLASNENPLGMSPRAAQAIKKAASNLHRYPEQHELVDALAKVNKIPAKQITIGNGSNDILDLIARAFLREGGEAISSEYAFAIYKIATQSAAAKNIIAPAKNYAHDLKQMLAQVTPRTKVVWIANPNNPTGSLLDAPELEQFFLEIPKNIVVVLDEAYYEYLPPEQRCPSLKWLKEFPNLIVVRTFSKIYGLAGLRVGYSFSSTKIAQALNRVRQPFNANNLAITAATAALLDQNFVQKSYEENIAGKKQLLAALDKIGIKYLPANGNFVTIELPNAAEANKKLLAQGIIVRPLDAYQMPSFLRVTIGTKEENQKFLEALEQNLSN